MFTVAWVVSASEGRWPSISGGGASSGGGPGSSPRTFDAIRRAPLAKSLTIDPMLVHPTLRSWRRPLPVPPYGSARIIPPSTGTIAPVTNDAAGDSRNAPTRPISATSP